MLGPLRDIFRFIEHTRSHREECLVTVENSFDSDLTNITACEVVRRRQKLCRRKLPGAIPLNLIGCEMLGQNRLSLIYKLSKHALCYQFHARAVPLWLGLLSNANSPRTVHRF